MSLETKKIDEINNETADVINTFAIKGKYRLIGSSSLRAIQYASDYDVETMLNGATPKKVADLLQKAFAVTAKDPDVWVIDFKCGHDERLVYKGDYDHQSLKKYLKNPLIPSAMKRDIMKKTGEEQIEAVRDLFILRWTHQDIQRGDIKLIDGTTKSLEDCILDKTTMKVDLIIKVGNQFQEVSENYYIKLGDRSNFTKMPSKKEMEDSLAEDIHYYSKVDTFKSLKRLFSLLQAEGVKKNKPQLDLLIAFFNSQVGYLNKIKNELTILEILLDQPRKPKWADVESNLQFIKEQISNVYKVPLTEKVFTDIDNITEKTALRDIRTLKDYFQSKINLESKKFLRDNI